ncbi:MAG: hypothetical protein NT068_02995 [Candidatus Nomurabacteria bacterium]|nr:hypothetical protein [Candidatus Nomurabacteria bacterium]
MSYKQVPSEILVILEIVKKLEKTKAEELMIMHREMDPEIDELIKNTISKFSKEEREFYVKTVKEFNFRDKKYYKDAKIEKSDWYDYMDERCRFASHLLDIIDVRLNPDRKSYSLEIDLGNPGYFKPKPEPKSSTRSLGLTFE